MRTQIWISSLAAAGLIVAGSVAPAYAAQSALTTDGMAGTTESQEVRGHAGTAAMAKMHRQMKKDMTDMTDMDMADMTDMTDMDMTDMMGESGGARMGAKMKAHHAAASSTSAHTHSTEQGQS